MTDEPTYVLMTVQEADLYLQPQGVRILPPPDECRAPDDLSELDT